MSLHHLIDRERHGRSLELAANAVDFDLTSAETGELERHLAACPSCTRRAVALRADARALTQPLTLLPSRRVDEAVSAAIVRRPAPPQRLLLLAAAALLLAALLGAVAVGGYLLRSSETLPTTVVPSPTAPLAVVSAEPDASPTAGPAATKSPTQPVASAVDPMVLLRVEIRPDVSVGRIPSLTVYRDGTVLRRDDASGRITRLTAAGLALVLAPARDSDLLVTSGEIRPDPAYQGGFTTYTIDFQRGNEYVHRSTTNSFTPATRAEGERIIALAEYLDGLASWLPADAWATGASAFEPYIASHFLLKVTVFKQLGVDYPPQALDRADVKWPLEGFMEGFGDLAEPQPLGDGTTSRCGPVTLAEAAAVQRALAAAPLVRLGERLQADLDWAPSIGHVTVTLAPLLPEDAIDCTSDGSWP
jgi:hypothetical protein